MPGRRKLSKIQMGLEDAATQGTAVVATVIWRGPANFFDDEEIPVFIEEDVGLLSPLGRSYIPKTGAVLDMPETEATYEQLPYILMAGVETVGTSSATNSTGTWYTWTYSFATGATKTTSTYTIETGDDVDQTEAEYCFVEDFHLTGAVDGALMMSAIWRGRQVTESVDFTTGISMPAVEEIVFNKCVLSIDANTVGTTPITGALIDLDFHAVTGLQAYTTADGNLYFYATKQVGPEITMDITFEHITAAVTEKAACKAQTLRLIELVWTGTDAVGGQAKTLTIQMAGYWESFDVISESDGNNIVAGHFRVAYSSTEALYCTIAIINALAVLP